MPLSRSSKHDLREVEVSPDGRYVRFEEKLGSGAYKEVYLCYDTETGKECAWNTVNLARIPVQERRRIRMETEILASLHHPHVINFYAVWENREADQICFATEIVTSGTLKEYTSRVKNIKLKVIKKWCRQILNGLHYLHSHSPPIIHRDLKCDNIFINGSTGEVRIGDFGLSVARHTTHVESVLGTPEFMAPELYDENYSESVDIYAFGMCVIEMTTKEYPFEECNNAAQIWKRVSQGQKPDVLARIKDHQVRAFVEVCLSSQELRLSAKELLTHPFLKFKRSDPGRDSIVVTVESKRLTGPGGTIGVAERERNRQLDKADRQERAEREQRDREAKYADPSTPANNTNEPPHLSLYNVGQSNAATNNASITNSNNYNNHHSNQPSTPSHSLSRPPSIQPDRQRVPSSSNIQGMGGSSVSPGSSPTGLTHSTSHSNLTQSQRANQQQQQQQQQQSSQGHSQQPHTSSKGQQSGRVQVPSPSSVQRQTSNNSNVPQSIPSQSSNPQPAPPLEVQTVAVDIESITSHTAHITLHLAFTSGKKKQIKFDFDVRHDTSMSIASEMVRALKLANTERTTGLIAHTIESKVEPIRKNYFDAMRNDSNHSQNTTPHQSGTYQPGQSQSGMSHSASHPHLHGHHHQHSASMSAVHHPSQMTAHALNGMTISQSGILKRNAATLPHPHQQQPQQQQQHYAQQATSASHGNHPHSTVQQSHPYSQPPQQGHRREHSISQPVVPGSRSSTPHSSGVHSNMRIHATNSATMPHPLVKAGSAGTLPPPGHTLAAHGQHHSSSTSSHPTSPLPAGLSRPGMDRKSSQPLPHAHTPQPHAQTLAHPMNAHATLTGPLPSRNFQLHPSASVGNMHATSHGHNYATMPPGNSSSNNSTPSHSPLPSPTQHESEDVHFGHLHPPPLVHSTSSPVIHSALPSALPSSSLATVDGGITSISEEREESESESREEFSPSPPQTTTAAAQTLGAHTRPAVIDTQSRGVATLSQSQSQSHSLSQSLPQPSHPQPQSAPHAVSALSAQSFEHHTSTHDALYARFKAMSVAELKAAIKQQQHRHPTHTGDEIATSLRECIEKADFIELLTRLTEDDPAAVAAVSTKHAGNTAGMSEPKVFSFTHSHTQAHSQSSNALHTASQQSSPIVSPSVTTRDAPSDAGGASVVNEAPVSLLAPPTVAPSRGEPSPGLHYSLSADDIGSQFLLQSSAAALAGNWASHVNTSADTMPATASLGGDALQAFDPLFTESGAKAGDAVHASGHGGHELDG